jgi:Ribonuclease G/E
MTWVMQVFRQDDKAPGGSRLGDVRTVERRTKRELQQLSSDVCPTGRGSVVSYHKGRVCYTSWRNGEGNVVGREV